MLLIIRSYIVKAWSLLNSVVQEKERPTKPLFRRVKETCFLESKIGRYSDSYS